MNTKRFFIWGGFIVIIGLIIWGMVAASQKEARDNANIVLPDSVVSTDHILGKTDAKLTIVEYGDFECPACGIYYPMVKKITDEYSSTTLRLVFRHFPLSQHPKAIPAAKVAESAGKQGKFFEMYDLLYSNQDEWIKATNSDMVFEGYAKKLGLDMAKFKADINDPEIAKKIDNDYKGGAKGGVNSTPTFFLNGKSIKNPQTYVEFKKIIEDAANSK
jgi:protein-disulfide isomerase